MKNCTLFLVYFFIFLSAFSQRMPFAVSNTLSTNNKITWKPIVEQNLYGLEKQKLLVFEHAHYNFNIHTLPIFSQITQLPKGVTSADISLVNAGYELLTNQEINVITSSPTKTEEILSAEIHPSITISYYKKQPVAYIQLIPIRKNSVNGKYEKLVSFSLEIHPVLNKTQLTPTPLRKYASSSILATGRWYKISVVNDGIYRIDYSFLKEIGINPDSINPKHIRIYGNGGGQLPYANNIPRIDDLAQNSIFVAGENDGKFDSTDYVLFYGQSQHRWKYSYADKRFHHNLNIYSDTTYYFITTNLGTGKRLSTQSSSSSSPTKTVSSYNDYAFHEMETNNLLKSGREWLGETFDIISSYKFNFSFSNIDPGTKAYAKINMAARRDSPGTDFYWTIGNVSSTFNVPGVVTSNVNATYYKTSTDTLSFSPSAGSVQVTISKSTPSPAIGWLDYIEVNARQRLSFDNNELLFRDIQSVSPGSISRFIISNSSSNLQVWDVTNPINVKLQQSTYAKGITEFTLSTDSLREFVAFTGQNFPSPKFSVPVKNQNLHKMSASDLIIVTHPLFLEQANALAELHRTADSLTVSVATTEEIFNEFSSGAQDVSAIRDFIKMFYDRGSDSSPFPKYLLLVGRGSYNLKATINNTNFVPAYESLNSADPTSSYSSDDFYCLLDDNEGNWDFTPDVLDIGVGRLPVSSISEATIVLDKITYYSKPPGTIETGNSCTTDICNSFGDWANTITFCADDEDGSSHLLQADAIATKINSQYKNYNIDKIYLDAFQQISTPGGDRYPDATEALMRRMDKGSLIVNYTGHGGELGWAHERFLEIYHINSWTNKCKLPLFFTATCEFSRWDDPSRISAGELTFLHPNGGSIGLMSTSRVVYSGPNYVLNDAFYNFSFNPLPDRSMPRLGDLHLFTKNSMQPGAINQRNFASLSDPAMRLKYPDYTITTTSFNGHAINPSTPDTAKALSEVTVTGEIHNKSGNILNNFNGIIYPTVYDKSALITTLSNDGPIASPPVTFTLQKNILFKGKASVTNGKFRFSFIVPKDIAFNYAKGKISYYAHNGFESASGYFEDFLIGGINESAVKDVVGPQINLYMNDDKFVFGGITNNDPKVYAVINDSSGINTAGTSIGHDITAVLDGNNSNPLVLNDYYESELNNYKQGSVRYPLSNLAEGNHTLAIKVWDVYNNSSTSYTEFVVASSAQLALKHVLNYPNPFTTHTSFFFEHNKCCTNMDVQIEIFTISGKLVKTIHQAINMEGYRSDPIDWDGKDDFGDKIGRGVYIYRLKVKTATGESSEKIEKLVVLK